MGNLSRLNIEIPTEVKRKAMHRCIRDGESLSRVVRRMLLDYVEEGPSQEFVSAIKMLNIELHQIVKNAETQSEHVMLQIKKNENETLAKRLEYFAKTQERLRKKKT